MRNWLVLSVAVVLAAFVALVRNRPGDVEPAPHVAPADATSALAPRSPSAPARGPEQFVGSAACAHCHRAQSDAYLGSHHAKALVKPDAGAKARFDGAHSSSPLGGTTTFSWRDGAPFVQTRIAGGKVATFPIAYVSGVWPLEQYVVATERGKLQSLGVVWDTRARAEGGEQWLHVYGPRGIAPDDPLFFTSPAQSWNHICADCHSTRVERRYDVATDSFDTRWAELSVGCEACHGPGAEHVRTAKLGKPAPLAARLRHAEPWMPSATGSPTPRPRDEVELEVCAPCHSRRTPIAEGFIASDALLNAFLPELLRPARFHADGQVEGEVYEWASFQQSRMYQAGVKCSDCHDAHSGKPYASGNALCVRCHEPSRFDVPAHSRHTGSSAPRCVDCHMPPSTFMQIDERRDHSIRIPRPDLSVELGTPNACNGCHSQQPASWARDALAGWYPASRPRPHFGVALAHDRKGSLDAPGALRRLAADSAAPAIARATALERLGAYPGAKTNEVLRAALTSPEPLLVYGAALGAASLPPPQRAPLLLPVLEHPRRAVRVVAARALAPVPRAQLPVAARAALERGFDEVEQSFQVGASRPETHVERGAFELSRGRLSEAEAALRVALRLEPCSAEAHLNLADLERQRGDEAAAGKALHEALACSPKNAAAHHALGLWQVRSQRLKEARVSLAKAAELAPADPRFSYVLAAALADGGERERAIRVLEASLSQRSNEASILSALAGYLREAGQLERAGEVQRRLQVLLHD